VQTIYIETSVVSYYASSISDNVIVAGHQVSTNIFWKQYVTEGKALPVISALVIKEASQGNIVQAKKRRDSLKDFLVLDISQKAEELAELLIKEKGIPKQFPEDALHIAIASVENIDFIATWNFKHINNPYTKNKIETIIDAAGYKCPVLASPDELLGE